MQQAHVLPDHLPHRLQLAYSILTYRLVKTIKTDVKAKRHFFNKAGRFGRRSFYRRRSRLPYFRKRFSGGRGTFGRSSGWGRKTLWSASRRSSLPFRNARFQASRRGFVKLSGAARTTRFGRKGRFAPRRSGTRTGYAKSRSRKTASTIKWARKSRGLFYRSRLHLARVQTLPIQDLAVMTAQPVALVGRLAGLGFRKKYIVRWLSVNVKAVFYVGAASVYLKMMGEEQQREEYWKNQIAEINGNGSAQAVSQIGYALLVRMPLQVYENYGALGVPFVVSSDKETVAKSLVAFYQTLMQGFFPGRIRVLRRYPLLTLGTSICTLGRERTRDVVLDYRKSVSLRMNEVIVLIMAFGGASGLERIKSLPVCMNGTTRYKEMTS